jgi:hypothetical protein
LGPETETESPASSGMGSVRFRYVGTSKHCSNRRRKGDAVRESVGGSSTEAVLVTLRTPAMPRFVARARMYRIEGDDPITTARESLMRMYLDLKRYDAAYRLGERLADDPSVWIRYSYAVMALQQKKPHGEMHGPKGFNRILCLLPGIYDTNGVMEYGRSGGLEDEPLKFRRSYRMCSRKQYPCGSIRRRI